MSAFMIAVWFGGILGARTAKASWFDAIIWPSSLGYALGRYAILAERHIDARRTGRTE